MTEKRFYIKESESTGEYPVFDRLNDDECVAVSDVERISQKTCDLLNNLHEENEQLKFENNELKCALALDNVDYIIADGKKIDIPPYYEFKQRYDNIMHRREYEGYD